MISDDGNDFTKDVNGTTMSDEHIRDLLKEKIQLDADVFPHSMRLISDEVTKAQAQLRSGKKYTPEDRIVDVYNDKPVKVITKVRVPVQEHPTFNFVGKLLGPQGSFLKQLQEDTMTKMSILGRGSIRDKAKEEELRNSLDPNYAHLSEELHVEVTALASPAEAYARISYALVELQKCLVPNEPIGIAGAGAFPALSGVGGPMMGGGGPRMGGGGPMRRATGLSFEMMKARTMPAQRMSGPPASLMRKPVGPPASLLGKPGPRGLFENGRTKPISMLKEKPLMRGSAYDSLLATAYGDDFYNTSDDDYFNDGFGSGDGNLWNSYRNAEPVPLTGKRGSFFKGGARGSPYGQQLKFNPTKY